MLFIYIVVQARNGFRYRWQVLTGAPPFAGQQGPEFACQVTLEGKRPPRPNSSETLGITDEIWDLLELCWTEDVSSRPEVNHVVGCLERAEKHEKAQKIADELDKVRRHAGRSNTTMVLISNLRPLTASGSVTIQGDTLGAYKTCAVPLVFFLYRSLLPGNWRGLQSTRPPEAVPRTYTRRSTKSRQSR